MVEREREREIDNDDEIKSQELSTTSKAIC